MVLADALFGELPVCVGDGLAALPAADATVHSARFPPFLEGVLLSCDSSSSDVLCPLSAELGAARRPNPAFLCGVAAPPLTCARVTLAYEELALATEVSSESSRRSPSALAARFGGGLTAGTSEPLALGVKSIHQWWESCLFCLTAFGLKTHCISNNAWCAFSTGWSPSAMITLSPLKFANVVLS